MIKQVLIKNLMIVLKNVMEVNILENVAILVIKKFMEIVLLVKILLYLMIMGITLLN